MEDCKILSSISLRIVGTVVLGGAAIVLSDALSKVPRARDFRDFCCWRSLLTLSVGTLLSADAPGGGVATKVSRI